MRFSVKLPDGQKLIIIKQFWTGKTEIRLDNAIIGNMGMKREQSFKLKYKDGSEHSLSIKQPLFDPLPYAFLNGHDVFASKRFDKLQTAAICSPLLLCCMLGAIPAMIGCGGVYINYFIARQDEWKAPARWGAIASVPIVGLTVLLLINGAVWQTTKAKDKLSPEAQVHHYDPTEDDRDPRLWARPSSDPAEAARQERWVREGR